MNLPPAIPMKLIVGVVVGGVGGMIMCVCCCFVFYWTNFHKPGNAITIHHEDQTMDADFIPEVMLADGARPTTVKATTPRSPQTPRPVSENFSQFFFPEAGTFQAGPQTPI